MADVFDANGCDLAYAHAQKNIGIAGVTVVVVRKSLLDRIAGHSELPGRPPVTWLMLGWLAGEIGGLAEMGAINRRKAAALYGFLDETPFYRPLVAGLAGHRSVGGCRASLFNGVTEDMVARLIDFMHGFERRNRGESSNG